MNILLANINNT